MTAQPIPFKEIRIGTPCSADWNAMTGDERARFCGQCQKHVYNFSAMTQAQVQALILEKEGKFCARFYRRADGTMMTADCPVGLKALRYRMAKYAIAAFTILVTLIISGFTWRMRNYSLPPSSAQTPKFLAKWQARILNYPSSVYQTVRAQWRPEPVMMGVLVVPASHHAMSVTLTSTTAPSTKAGSASTAP